MNKIYFSIILVALAFFMTSCDKDDDNHEEETVDYAYHAHINSPDESNKHLGDILDIQIQFESHAGEPVHHINVRIYNADDNTELYNKPAEAHVHGHSGEYLYSDDFLISEENGFVGHGNYVFEAKVWGENEGDGEEIETVEFHVHE